MSWIGVAMVGAGTAASVGGGIMTSNSNLKTAQAQAAAENKVLSDNITQQEGYSGQTEGLMNSDLANYTPAAQSGQLAAAQGSRGNTDVANITAPTTADIPGQSSAPAAETQDIAKRMGAAMDYATSNAKAQGNLKGYGDSWFTNQLANSNTNREMAPIEGESQLEASLLPEEQTIAGEGAYSPPSVWGQILTGAGGVLASAGGGKIGAGGGVPSLTPSASPSSTGSAWDPQ